VSYSETMQQIETQLPNIEGLLDSIEMKGLFIEIPNDWFLKYDIAPRGIQMFDRMCWLISVKQFEELTSTRPGPNRQKGVGYRWKEVY
jgi:hypothetical protein